MARLLTLKIESLAVIEEAELSLSEGLNVLTGETGAGKTVLAGALESLLGASTPKGVVRPGADAAYIEGVFALSSPLALPPELQEIVDENPGEVTLARRIAAEGRSRCLVNGRTVSLENLKLLAGQLIAFYGQHEGRKLVMEKAQVDMLDRSGDGEGLTLRESFQSLRAQAQACLVRLEALKEQGRAESREVDLARFELEELEALEPRIGEEAELSEELELLSGALEGREACLQASGRLEGEEGVDALISEAARALAGHAGAAQGLSERLDSARIEISDICSELNVLIASWEANPARQAEVEGRLSEYQRLCRKHGVAADQLIDVKSGLEAKVAETDRLPQMTEQAEQDFRAGLAACRQAAEQLTAWRAKQAPLLSASVTELLGELSMPEASFQVVLEPLAEGQVPASSGDERVVFKLQANPGLEAQPITEVASGGEVSRLMLALISEAGLGGGEVLILDEPDVGIGGHTAHGVAGRMQALAGRHQLLVISHLPQIAAKAATHFSLVKEVKDGSTLTSICRIEGREGIVDELCRMSGHDPGDSAARSAAESLM